MTVIGRLLGTTVTTTLTWGEGRMLTGIRRDAQNQTTYTYNADGLRTEKAVTKNGTTAVTRYIWGDNGLAAAITGDQTVVVLYDSEGESVGFSVDGTVYTYVKNLQGDVLRVLDADGAAVVSYTYNPWGVPTVSGDSDLAAINPCSYRGYYYDQETGYYYLQSRYYDSSIGRFLNADDAALLSINRKFTSHNLFVYCGNSPADSSDPNGYFYISLASMKNILCVIGLNPIATVLIGMGLAKLKSFLVAKCAILLAKLGAFWGPVVQFAFAVVGLFRCIFIYGFHSSCENPRSPQYRFFYLLFWLLHGCG